MSLHLASRYADALGVTHVLLTPDRDGSRIVQIDTDKPVTPGAAATLRNRAWLAVQNHRHSFQEPVAVLGEPWSLRRTPTGAWQLQHENCGMRRAA